MDRVTKMLKCMEIDAINLYEIDHFDDAEGMIAWYKSKSEEEINEIYKEYYGEEKLTKATQKKLVMMVVGEMEFSLDSGSHLVNHINRILFVDVDLVDEIGESFLEAGYDAYLVPSMTSASLESPNHWYVVVHETEYVVIDPQMNVTIGFGSLKELHKHYPDAKAVAAEEELFWTFYGLSKDYTEPKKIMKKIKVTVEAETWVEVDSNEDITTRCADIYLYGKGKDGHCDKVDLGGRYNIEILEEKIAESI